MIFRPNSCFRNDKPLDTIHSLSITGHALFLPNKTFMLKHTQNHQHRDRLWWLGLGCRVGGRSIAQESVLNFFKSISLTQWGLYPRFSKLDQWIQLNTNIPLCRQNSQRLNWFKSSKRFYLVWMPESIQKTIIKGIKFAFISLMKHWGAASIHCSMPSCVLSKLSNSKYAILFYFLIISVDISLESRLYFFLSVKLKEASVQKILLLPYIYILHNPALICFLFKQHFLDKLKKQQ